MHLKKGKGRKKNIKNKLACTSWVKLLNEAGFIEKGLNLQRSCIRNMVLYGLKLMYLSKIVTYLWKDDVSVYDYRVYVVLC
jgi:hypothetical protein